MIVYVCEVVENELNFINDNLVVCEDEDNVLYGGNFYGDYVLFEMDKFKLVVIRVFMFVECQLNFLMNVWINGVFLLFFNVGKFGFNFGIQGIQFMVVFMMVENQMFFNLMYVYSILNNNDNQDIVSMGMNGVYICKCVIDNVFQVMVIYMLVVCQVFDLFGVEVMDNMSFFSCEVYDSICRICLMIIEDQFQFENIYCFI